MLVHTLEDTFEINMPFYFFVSMPTIGAMMGTVFQFFFRASTFTPSTKCKKKANETKIFLRYLE